MNRRKRVVTIRRVLLALLLIIVLLIARPAGYIAYTWLSDHASVNQTTENDNNSRLTDDASRLNATALDSVIHIDADRDEAIIQLRAIIQHAAESGSTISIAGARHSMGGHTMYPDGIVLDMTPFNWMQLDTANNLLTAGAGAKWSDIIPYLDRYQKSMLVMQSNNSFTVGGSISVNCHGWQPKSPPISTTVESFRLINANGEILTCSRSANTELFSLVLGGYGLFGVLLDVQLHVTENRMYKLKQHVIESAGFIEKYHALVDGRKDVGLVYGRVNINPDDYMNEAILSVFTIDPTESPGPLTAPTLAKLRRTVFRGSAGSDYGKNLRWKAEKLAARVGSGKTYARNVVLNEPVGIYQNTDTAYTDILHEYFIPRDSVQRFIDVLRKTIPRYEVDLLNITLRNVQRDDDTFLSYAREDVFGFVLLFNQKKSAESELAMKALTQQLISEAIALRGTYYLPYRLHATRAQFRRAYPNAEVFLQLKRQYDPKEIFVNKFYEEYR